MNREMRNLEFEIDRDLAKLAPLLDAAPLSLNQIEAMRSAVAREASRIRSARRNFGYRSIGLSAAAAILLAVSFGLIQTGRSSVEPRAALALADAEQSIDDWISAVADSSDVLSTVVQQTWTSDEANLEAAPDDAVDSFLESFDRIETMTGA